MVALWNELERALGQGGAPALVAIGGQGVAGPQLLLMVRSTMQAVRAASPQAALAPPLLCNIAAAARPCAAG